jgi:hypothetical protein
MVPFVESYLLDVLQSKAAGGHSQSILSKLLFGNGLVLRARAMVSEWNSGPESLAVIDTLNEASIGAFLDYSARLEGVADANAAIESSKWPHLPYWLQSVWLPMDGVDHRPKIVDIGGMPTLIGTTGGLVANLNEIAKASDIQFGVMPQYFDVMLANPNAFYAMDMATFDETTTLKWIWLAYMTGTDNSLKYNRPLWSGG